MPTTVMTVTITKTRMAHGFAIHNWPRRCGMPEMMLPKMIRDKPLPIPSSSISSPIQIASIVPATSVSRVAVVGSQVVAVNP